MPIGGVVAYKDRISISGVGMDIACGNLACRTDADPDDVRANIDKIMDDVVSQVSFGIGRTNKENVDSNVFYRQEWHNPAIKNIQIKGGKDIKDFAREQLGTVGSGNHYVDIFVDEKDRVWIGVHFGSRGLGHKITTHFLKAAGAKDGMMVEPCVVDVDSDLGMDYLDGLRLAGHYAYAGREWVCNKIIKDILGATSVEEVHNHHNFAWLEKHGGEEYWVVRKGATPAFPGQKGFVGGSMGDNAVILEGVQCPEAEEALYSTVHGAGRVMSRNQAAGKKRFKKGQWVRISEGEIKKEDMHDWIQKRGVTLRGADCDEAPQAYRRLDDVLECHSNTIRILHTLRPIGVAMAGADTFDPYKD
jgi:tRNA-splicing ligase RtcB